MGGGGGGGGGGQWTGTSEIYFEGNVGISNTDPDHDLSVGSNLYIDDDGSNVLVISGNAAMSSLTLGQVSIVASYGLDDILSTSNISSNTMRLTNATTGLVTTGNVSVGNDLTVTGDMTAGYLYGDVSNVTAVPAAQITGTLAVANGGTGVNGSTGTGDVVLSIAPAFSGDVAFDTNTLFVDSTENRVGVGTIAPTRKLHVSGDGQTATGGVIHSTLTDPSGAPYESNAFSMNMGGYGHSIRMELNMLSLNAYGDAGRYGKMKFVVGDNASSGSGQITAMTLLPGGNVGIGTTSPATKLHVSGGKIRVDDTERIEFGAGGVAINNEE